MTRPFDPDPSPRQWAERLGNLKQSGGEYKGPCPLCGGTDRFHVREGDVPGKVLAKCRQCEATYPALKAAVFPPDDSMPTRPRRVNGSKQPAGPKPQKIGERFYHYFSADGSEFAAVKRVDYADGSKAFYPPKGLKRPYPLYQLPDVIERDTDPVLIVEGEKAADAAQERFSDYVVTTSMGVGNVRASESDWRALAGRDVTIWPDADEAGIKYAAAVHRLALDAGAADARVIELPGTLPDKWDLADAMPDGFDARACLDANTSGIEFVPMAEFMAQEHTARDWLLSGLLPADGLAMIAAAPKVGKSTLARCLAVAVADPDRSEFLGRTVATGLVFHLTLEESAGTVQAHYRSIGCPPGIHIWCKPAMDIAPTIEERIEELARSIRATNPVLVIIDTMGRFIPFKDMNDHPEVTAMLEPVLALARRHKTLILFVHHARKSGGEYGADALGSTALTGSMDTTISITRNATGRSFTATGRDGVETDSPIALSDDGWIDAAGTRAEVTYENTKGKVWRVLFDAAPEWLTRAQVIEATKPATQATVISALIELGKCGDVESTGKGVKGDAKRYRANPDRL